MAFVGSKNANQKEWLKVSYDYEHGAPTILINHCFFENIGCEMLLFKAVSVSSRVLLILAD